MAIVVERLSKDSKVIQHYFFDKPRISLGRAYDNDIRIDDPYVCPGHAVIAESDQHDELELEDSASLNGVKVNNARITTSKVSEKDIITLGRTRFRVFKHSRSVAPAIHLSKLEENIEWLGRRSICAGLLMVFCSIVTLQFFFNSFAEVNYAVMAKLTLTVVATFSIWPLAFGLLSKLAKKDAHIISQFSLLWLCLIGLELVDYLTVFLEFNSEYLRLVEWLGLIGKGIIIAGLLWFSLFLGFHQSKSIRNGLTVAGLVLFGLPTVLPMLVSNDDFINKPKYKATVLPPALQWSSAASTEEFITDNDQLFKQLAENIRDNDA